MRQDVNGLNARVDTDRTQYAPSRAVEIGLTLTNTGRNNRQIDIRSGFEYDIVVRDDRTGQAVWTWSKGRRGAAPYRFFLAPGESRFSRELWDKRDDNRRPLPAGVYRVEATLTPLRQAVWTKIFLSERDAPGDGRPGPGPGVPSTPGPLPGVGQGLVGRLALDRASVRPGGVVRFTYTVANRSTQPIALRFRSGQRFDIEAARRPEPNARYAKGALTVWQLSQGMSYFMALGQETFAPGETRTFTAEWRVPADAPALTLDLRAWLTAEGPVAETGATLQIVP